MAIQISGTTVIDNSRNVQNVGIITATSLTTNAGTFGSNGVGTRTIQSGGSASGGSSGDIYYIY